MEKEKTALVDKSEDYQKGYYDGYHKGYSDKKQLVRKAKKEAKDEYMEKLKNLSISTIYPFNVIYDVIEDRDAEPLYSFSPELIMKTITETLTIREADVLLCRYRDGMTLDEVGKKFNVGKERIRQIEAKALRKLKHPTRMNSMRAVSYNDYKELESRYSTVEYAYNQLSDKKEIPELISETSVEGMPIMDLNLSVRSYNCLYRANIRTVGDLINKTRHEMERVRNLGKRSLFEIEQKLISMGLGFRTEE